MDEGDSSSTPSDSWLFVDETRSPALQVSEGGFDRAHGIGNMVQTFTLLGQEATHRGFRAQWLQQLYERAANWNHRLLHALFLHPLTVKGLHVVPVSIAFDRQVEVLNGYGHMIQIEKFHRHEARARSCHGGPR